MPFEDFKDFPKLIEIVRALYRRPRPRCGWEHTPPVLACVQPRLRQDPGLLGSISARLSSPDRRVHVPHALVQLPQGDAAVHAADAAPAPLSTDKVDELCAVLRDTTNTLADPAGGAYRFPRLWLVLWLMQLSLPVAPLPDQLAALRNALYRRAVKPAAPAATAAAADGIPGWLSALGILLTPLFFRMLHSGRIPLLGRRYRSLRQQPYIAPANTSFFQVARRLTKDEWKNEDLEQVACFLVSAFLEDLRAPFRSKGRLRRYRTTFPIVLLDGITRANGGYTLLRIISEVRNGVEVFDPLLLITTSRRVPPLATPTPPGPSPTNPLVDWSDQLEKRSRRRDIAAWVVIIPIPAAATAPSLATVQSTVQQLAPLTRPHRKWWRTPLVTAGGAAVVLAGYGIFGVVHSNEHCGDGFTFLGIEPMTSAVHRIGNACIGVTDGSNPLLFPGSTFDEVRLKIVEQNELALKVKHEQPNRPLMTLVFMGSLTAVPSAGAEVFTAEPEQLAGMAVAQARQLEKSPQNSEPLVRVLIANAGPRLRHGPAVAKQLGEMAKADPSIVAVVGLVESRDPTAETIKALAAAGLPTVAATLTADTMVESSKLYFQISPQNRREAAVAAAHVDRLMAGGRDPFGRPLARRAVVVRSDDPSDTYSQNLAADLDGSLTSAGIPVQTVAFSPSGEGPARIDAWTAGREACDAAGGAVLYAARGLIDFQAFVDGIADGCRADPPYVLGGDDVTRYVADRNVSGTNRSVPFQYLSLALAPELEATPSRDVSDFYARLNRLLPYEETDRGRTLDGHAALNYDAAYTVITAVKYLYLDGIAINGSAVWPALMSVTDAGSTRRAIQGVTGDVDFGGTVDRRVPVDKPVAIVTFRDGSPRADETIVCAARDKPGTPPWCPVDDMNDMAGAN
ncbi:ABC transporter substrate-binding protein [Actinomycetes bacterium KLBMP 9759]